MAHVYTAEQLKERLIESILQNKFDLVARSWVPSSSSINKAQQIIIEKVRRYSGKALVTDNKSDNYILNNSYNEEKQYRPYNIGTGFEANKEVIKNNPDMAKEEVDTAIQENTRTMLETDEYAILYGDSDIDRKGLLNSDGINIFPILADSDGKVYHEEKAAESIISDIDATWKELMLIPGVRPNVLAIDIQLAAIYQTTRFSNNSTGDLKETIWDALERTYNAKGVSLHIHACLKDSSGNSTYAFADARAQNFEIKDLDALTVKEDTFKETETKAYWRLDRRCYFKYRKPWTVIVAEGTTEIPAFDLDVTDF